MSVTDVPTPALELHRATLSNGLRVLVVPDPATPVVGVAVHVDVGFRSEPEGRTGFAHLFEHLMFQGSESLEKLEHFRQVQAAGGIFNGSTHQDYTDYFQVLPGAALERALFLEADRLRAPKLTRENLRNQVDVVKEEIRLNVHNRPYGGFPWILLPPVLYDTFPNAHNGYGDFSELEQAGLDDAAAFFDTFYAPGNALVTVHGDLGEHGAEGTLALVERHFGDIPARPVPRRPSFAEPVPGTERARLETGAAEAELSRLRALRAQISPHFVYNALTTIASFVRSDPARARDLLETFAEFIRHSLAARGDYTTLAGEFRSVEAYLTLARAVLGDRLRVQVRVAPEVLPVAIPVLALQPLVENAVQHGVERSSGGGLVQVSGEAEGDECVVAVEDDGPGMSPEHARAVLAGTADGSGLALVNVDRRLRAVYGPGHGLVIETAPDAGTRIVLRIPRFAPGVVP